MKQLSIIIPALGSQSDVDDTLVSVLENRPPDCDVLLIHPAQYIDPYDLGDEIRLVVSEGVDLWSLLNLGIQAIHTEVVHILLPGVTVTPNWSNEAVAYFEEDRNVGAVALPIAVPRARSSIYGIDYDSGQGKRFVRDARKSIVSPTIQAGFYRSSALRFMRGFDAGFADCADVELGLRLRSANYTVTKSNVPVSVAKPIRWRPPAAFQGGVIRAKLLQTARELDLTTSTQGWCGLISELPNNRFGVGVFGSLLGRASVWAAGIRRRPTLKRCEPTPTSPVRRRRAA